MARLRFENCVSKAFEPLIRASGRHDLSDRLRVQPPPESERRQQFQKFASLRDDKFSPLFLPNGGFFFPFHIEDTQCFAFSSFLDETDLGQSLSKWLEQHDATIEKIDQATFLFLAYHASNFYALRPEFQSRRESDEIVGLAEFPSYEGHNVSDLIGYFRPTYVITVPRDSLLEGIDPYVVATEILSLVPNLRPPIIDEIFSQRVYHLLSIPSVQAESLFLTLNSTRWRYVYLELFRIVEATLYLPWVLDLKAVAPSAMGAPDLYKSLRDKLDWREIKGKSIKRIFSELDSSLELREWEELCESFRFLDKTTTGYRASVAEKIYKIRNQLVHPQDFTDGSTLTISEDEFRRLCIYLCEVIRIVYARYDLYLRTETLIAA